MAHTLPDASAPFTEPAVAGRCTDSVKAFLTVAALALCFTPTAGAKFRLWVVTGDSTPAVGQPIAVVVRSQVDLDYDLKLIAVAPGRRWADVAGAVLGDVKNTAARLPRDGFAVRLVRVTANRWRGRLTFPHPGRWQLIVPNWAEEGLAYPPPVVRPVVVR
jgi:hypothetical protein